MMPHTLYVTAKKPDGSRELTPHPLDDFIAEYPAYKIGICIPFRGPVHGYFAKDLANTIAILSETWHEELGHKEPIGIQTFWNQSSLLPMQRSELCQAALDANCTHVFFVDTDMAWNPRHLARAIHWNLPIVAANCVTKCFPSIPTAADFQKKRVYTSPESTGLQQVMQVGTAWMLIDTAVLRKMKYPFFQLWWNENNKEWLGEDMYFSRMAMEEAGAPIVVDHDISKEVKHIGDFFYDHQMNWDLRGIQESGDPEAQALYKLCTKHKQDKEAEENATGVI